MHSLVTVVTVLRWIIIACLALTILHPAKASTLSNSRDAFHVSTGSCKHGYITTYCYPPTGRILIQ